MKITFVIASIGKQTNGRYIRSWIMEPLSLAVLSSLTPDSIDRVFYDDRIETIPFDDKTDLVAINMETYTANRAYQIAKEYRHRNVKVVLGGFHATLMPEEAACHADAVVIGEAEGAWYQLLEDFKSGKLKKFYRQTEKTVFTHSLPDRSIFKGKKYPKISLVETGRGCKFGCEFCAVAKFFNNKYKARPIDDIIREIGQIKNKLIFFVDDNIGADHARAKELFKALSPLKIKWMSQASMDICDDNELLRLMAKSGCQGVLIGFESLKPDILRQMGKSVNRNSKNYEFVVRQLHMHNIEIYGTFVMGYGDTERGFQEVCDFGITNKLLYMAINHLVPFPGTPLYDRLKMEGRLIYDKWWLEPGYRFGDIVFRAENISPAELSGFCIKYRKKFFNIQSTFRRLTNRVHWSSPEKMQAYLLLNLFANHENRERRSLIVGGQPLKCQEVYGTVHF